MGDGRPVAAEKRAAWTVLSGRAWGRLWLLAPNNSYLCLCSQGATQRGLGPWCLCYGSVPGPTSSPIACHLLSLAVLPRPWTCSWRATPLSSLWQPTPSGAVPHRGGEGWVGGGWGGLLCACQPVAPCLKILPLPALHPQQVALGLGSLSHGWHACLPLPSVAWRICLSVTLCLPILGNPVFPPPFLVCLSLCLTFHMTLGLHLCLCWSSLQTWAQIRVSHAHQEQV